jgi:lysophospholipase L1-like esterase
MDARRSRRSLGCLFGTLLCAMTVGCSDDGGSATAESAAASTPGTPTEQGGLHLISLGDSDATGVGDEEGIGWVQRYADLVAEQTGKEVVVKARAREGLTSDALLAQIEQDDGLRDQITDADVVVIGAGGADLNAGDDAWAAGTCSGTACYEPGLAVYERNIADVAGAVAELRGDRPTVLRAVTPPNALTGAEDVIPSFLAPTATEVGVFQARSLRDATCAAVRAHGGECIDVLTAFNGPDGTVDAYAAGLLNHAECCYPNAEGQQLMAELLLETGTDPNVLP